MNYETPIDWTFTLNCGTARGLMRRFDDEIFMGEFVDEHGGGEYGEY